MRLLDPAALPERFDDVEALDDFLSLPSQALVDDLETVPGDILILGAGGKMGPTLARLARAARRSRRIIAVGAVQRKRLARAAGGVRHRDRRLRPARPRAPSRRCRTRPT